eukprot:SAG31_NODE_9505_length_1267_cov_1.342466_1_plen_203_part_00
MLLQAFTKAATGIFFIILDRVIDISVLVDMVMQMRMYNYDSKTKKLITDKKAIRKTYFRSWFLIDFCSVVPVDAVLLLVGSLMVDHAENSHALEVGLFLTDISVAARMLKLLRLVRLVKIKKLLRVDFLTHTVYSVLNQTEAKITKLEITFYFRLSFLVVLIMASGHILGCLWLLLGRHNVLQVQNPTGWMVNVYEQVWTMC